MKNKNLMKIFIFGNGNISFERYLALYYPLIKKYIGNKKVEFVVCDYKGCDTLVIEHIKLHNKVTIFHMLDKPRYKPDTYKTRCSNWNYIPGYETDEQRDFAACMYCTHFIAFDFNTSTNRVSATKRNILYCLELKKIRLL